MISIIESKAHSYSIPKERETRAVSMSADGEIEEWGTIILSITIGLLTLWFFLAMGGIFALVGPWMIFATIHLVQQKQVRKAGGQFRRQAIQLVASIRSCTGYFEYPFHEKTLMPTTPIFSPLST